MSVYPHGFKCLSVYDDRILVDIKYATSDNFIGRPIDGYGQNKAVVSESLGRGLKIAQNKAIEKGFCLKVFETYRPLRACEDILKWSLDPHDQLKKKEFYPYIDKDKIFEQGYLLLRSTHARGAAVDLTLVTDHGQGQELDMGTGFDFFDKKSNTLTGGLSSEVVASRKLLCDLMQASGFENYEKEWWHFTLKQEPFPNQFFDFTI